MKILCLKSGGVCAFRGCGRNLIEPGTTLDDAVIIGEMAHIVADSRQGPRGDHSMDERERTKHHNLILLCREHHKMIDSQPRTFSVPVLQQMKLDHEHRIKSATSNSVKETKEFLKVDTVHSTLLTVT